MIFIYELIFEEGQLGNSHRLQLTAHPGQPFDLSAVEPPGHVLHIAPDWRIWLNASSNRHDPMDS
jgi:hypothetical protein